MGKKIFIIDDDQDIIDSLKLVLESKGYEVDASITAKNAVEMVRKKRPDLVILDVMFPENSSEGFDTARELHADEEAKKVPILMLSAVNAKFNLGFTNKDRDDSWLPVAEFIEKPVEPGKLLDMVEKLTS